MLRDVRFRVRVIQMACEVQRCRTVTPVRAGWASDSSPRGDVSIGGLSPVRLSALRAENLSLMLASVSQLWNQVNRRMLEGARRLMQSFTKRNWLTARWQWPLALHISHRTVQLSEACGVGQTLSRLRQHPPINP